jgi:pimeloyl-ACP methyl ester carboxylesterase
MTEMVDAGGLAVRVADLGHAGVPLILIHGLAGSIESWEPVLSGLAASHRTIALDLPGHGHSDKPTAFSYQMDAMVETVERVLAARGVERAVWIGNSIGGQIALAAAVAGSQSVAGIVLVNSTGVDEAAMTALLSSPDRIKARAGVARDASLLDAALALMFTDPSSAPALRLAEVRLASARAPDRAAHARAVMHTAVRARQAQLEAALDRVRVPALVIWGEQDRLLGTASLGPLATLRGVSILRLSGVGHMPQLEAPAAVERAIVEFASSVRADTPESRRSRPPP